MKPPHTEGSRVKIPSILHLCRLGYEYVSLKTAKWDKETNVFTDIFSESIAQINPDASEDEIRRVYSDLSLDLENEDLGKVFYHRLTIRTGVKLIDFENFDNNRFHVVTELTCEKDADEFRPDITLLINGMPLVFIEVKKPNNRDGVLAERSRMIAAKQKESQELASLRDWLLPMLMNGQVKTGENNEMLKAAEDGVYEKMK